MKACPKCKTKFPDDSKIEYCICGHKFNKPVTFKDIMPDVMSDMFGGLGKKEEE